MDVEVAVTSLRDGRARGASSEVIADQVAVVQLPGDMVKGVAMPERHTSKPIARRVTDVELMIACGGERPADRGNINEVEDHRTFLGWLARLKVVEGFLGRAYESVSLVLHGSQVNSAVELARKGVVVELGGRAHCRLMLDEEVVFGERLDNCGKSCAQVGEYAGRVLVEGSSWVRYGTQRIAQVLKGGLKRGHVREDGFSFLSECLE